MPPRNSGAHHGRPRLVRLPGIGSRRHESGIDFAAAAVIGLFFIAAGYAMHAGSVVLIPLSFAVLLYLLLSNAVERAARLRVPRPIAALTALLLVFAPAVVGVTMLIEPASEWLRAAPTTLPVTLEESRAALSEFTAPLESVKDASAAVSDVVDDLTGTEQNESVVTMREPGLLEMTVTQVPLILAGALIAITIAYFLLLDGDRLMTVLLARSRRFGSRRIARRAVNKMRNDVSRYLATILIINCCLGAVSGFAFWLLELPNPMLWGVLAGALNFAPYVGTLITLSVVTVIGISTYPPGAGAAALFPGLVFLFLTIVEAQIITPVALGKRLDFSPAVMIVAVVTFAALWGVAGALMAVPLCVVGRNALSVLAAPDAAPTREAAGS